MIKYIFSFFIFILFLTGCAPEYAIKQVYIPPVGKKAKQCIRGCRISYEKCNINCNSIYNQCLNDAFQRAKDIKNIDDEQYQEKYNEYLQKLHEYNLKNFNWQNEYNQNYKDYLYFKNRCATHHDNYACNREDDLSYTIQELLNTKPKKPIQPKEESFNEIVANEQGVCSNNCGCNKNFDICFLNCGGEIQMKKICISNCDKEKK